MKNRLFGLGIFFAFTIVSSVYALPSPAIQMDNKAVAQACAPDIAAAGCTGAPTLKAALQCTKAFKKSHPGFKHSAACKAAVRQRHLDKQMGH